MSQQTTNASTSNDLGQQGSEGVQPVPGVVSDLLDDTLVDAPSLSPKRLNTTLVRNSSLSLCNDFNVLSVEHPSCESGES